MRPDRFRIAVLACLVAALPAFAGAAETRSAAPGSKAPAASITDLHWLVGRWAGTGMEGAAAGESWSVADEDRLVGHFHQLGTDGKLRFVELMLLHPRDDSLELRLKHFNPDLTGWEKQDGFVVFPLVAVEPGVWYFHGLTIRKVDERHMTITVRLRDGEGRVSEIPFRFARQQEGA